MREILFRGKRRYTDEWRYGHLAHINGSNFIIDSGATMGYDGMDEYEEIERKTVGQYTGLKDKNGKPIFEGDIAVVKQLNLTDHITIGYENGAFLAVPRNGFIYERTLWDYWYNDWDIEIVGNIYDDPELLEVKS
jgi:uncharacterized phage protein (TIGR01671 family)